MYGGAYTGLGFGTYRRGIVPELISVEGANPLKVTVGDKVVTVHVTPSTAPVIDTNGTWMRIVVRAEVSDAEIPTPTSSTGEEDSTDEETEDTQTDSADLTEMYARLDAIEKNSESFKYTYSSMEETLNTRLGELKQQENAVEKKCKLMLDEIEKAHKKRAAFEKLYERLQLVIDETVPVL
jgi:hypothetical protein